MIKPLIKYNNPFFWVLLHATLGIISAITPFPLILYFYITLISSIPYISSSRKTDNPLIYIIAYLVSFELLARMAQCSPYIPYEIGKYLMFFLLLFGIANGLNKGRLGLLLVLLLIPALLYDDSGQVRFIDIRFNIIGAINVGLSVWFFTGLKLTRSGLNRLLIVLLLPLISILAFTVYRTPDLSSFEFSLGGNFALSGGFGPNQVSTVFGIGMFLSLYMWLSGMTLSGKRWVDIGIVLLFTFQGLLSFSRGGMIGGGLSILIFTYYLFYSSEKNQIGLQIAKKAKRYLFPGAILLFLSIIIANSISDGKLLLRYQGETEGTLRGSKEKDLNVITSHRLAIFKGDLDLLKDSNYLGVGAAASRYLRTELRGVVAHVEVSRLLAEHGVLGLFYVIIIFKILFSVTMSREDSLYKGLLVGFVVLGWYTSFHAATRTYVTPLFIGMSLITIQRALDSNKRISKSK